MSLDGKELNLHANVYSICSMYPTI